LLDENRDCVSRFFFALVGMPGRAFRQDDGGVSNDANMMQMFAWARSAHRTVEVRVLPALGMICG